VPRDGTRNPITTITLSLLIRRGGCIILITFGAGNAGAPLARADIDGIIDFGRGYQPAPRPLGNLEDCDLSLIRHFRLSLPLQSPQRVRHRVRTELHSDWYIPAPHVDGQQHPR